MFDEICKMATTALSYTGLVRRRANIAFWGPNVAEIATLVFTLKTGKYTPGETSIYPVVEEFSHNEMTILATIPSANEGARRSMRPTSEYDGIVYVMDPTNSESLSFSKMELEGLLHDEAVTGPILVLVPKPDTSSSDDVAVSHDLPGLQETTPEVFKFQNKKKVAFLTYTLSPREPAGYQEDFASLKKARQARQPRSFAINASSSSLSEDAPPDSGVDTAGQSLPEHSDAMQIDSGPTAPSVSPSTPGSDAALNKMQVDAELRTSSAPSSSSDAPATSDTTGLYPSLPTALEVRVSDTDGRGVYSRYLRKPGDVLLSVKPHVAALSNEHLEEYCSSCFTPKPPDGPLKRCTGCKVLYYCDSKCQNADWSFHRHECAAIQKWISSSSENSERASIPGDAIRCLGRIVWRKQKLGQDSVWGREIDALQSHRTSISKDPNSHDSQTYTQLAHAIVRFLGLNSPQELAEYGMRNAAELVDLVSRFTTNTFTITTPSLAPLGACVSPAVALLNHSCDPNAVVVFPRVGSKTEEPQMQVIALKPIQAGEQILTAYIDTTFPHEKRQRILKDTYHFTCKCRLCAPPPNSPPDLREAMWCPKKCGGVCPLPTEENSLVRCTRCRSAVKDTDAVLDAVRVGEEALNKAEALQFSNPQKAIQLTTKLIPILVSAGAVPSSYPLLALSRLNASLLIEHLPSTDPNVEEVLSPEVQSSTGAPQSKLTPEEAQEALDEAIRAATRASTGLTQILTDGHPMRGIALAELGKLLAVDEPKPTHLKEASSMSSSSQAQSTTSSGTSTPQPQAGPPSFSAADTVKPFSLGPHIKSPPPYPPSGPARLKLAYETLVRAQQELMIGFGSGKNEGGEVGRQVRKLAVDVEKELSVWKEGIKTAMRDPSRVMK